MTRLALRELPHPVVSFVEETLGAKIVSFESQTGGFSLGAAARVVTETGTTGFVKAIGRTGFEGSYELYKREANILSALPLGGNVPRLLGALEVEDWIVLVMQDVAGHHPRTPGEILAVLDELLQLPKAAEMTDLPDARTDVAVPFSRWNDIQPEFRAMTDWARVNIDRLAQLAMGATEAIAGDQLVHGDLRPDNVLIDTNKQAWLVDWPWAVRGAQWFDALLFLLDSQQRIDGIDPDQILGTHPIFAQVRGDQIDAVLAGFGGYYVHAAQQPVREVAQSLADHQFQTARIILEWLERRSEASSNIPQDDHNVVS